MGIVQELRLGNFLNHSELGIVEVIGVGKEYIHCISNGQTHYETMGRFSPIPLTEEWLLKLGFAKSLYSGGKSFLSGSFQVSKGDNWKNFEYITIGRNEDGINEPSITIEYVHQLHNLFFALTGEELTIK